MGYMRGICLVGLLLASGCAVIAGLDHTFERDNGGGDGPDGSGGSGGSTATASGGGGMGSDGAGGGMGGMSGPPFCDVNDASLVACYTFNSGFNDESSFKNVNTESDSLLNGWEGTAAHFSSGKTMVITDEPFWHVDDFTVEMWTKLDGVPDAQYWIDSAGRFGMSMANSEAYCGIANAQFYIVSGPYHFDQMGTPRMRS